MSAIVTCPSCNQRYQVRAEEAGRQFACSKCGQPLTVPRPNSAAPKEVAPSLGDFLEEELAGFHGPEHHRAPPGTPACPNCQAPMPAGAILCVACGYDFKTGKMRETVSDQARLAAIAAAMAPTPVAVEAPAPKRRRKAWTKKDDAKDSLFNLLAKLSTILLIGGTITYLGIRFYRGVSHLQVEGHLQYYVSQMSEVAGEARWLDLVIGYIAGYVQGLEPEVQVTTVPAPGIWKFTLECDRQNMVFCKAEMENTGGKRVRKQYGLKGPFHNALMGMGYCRPKNEQPDPLIVQSFEISDPFGKTWKMQGKNATYMCNLATMMCGLQVPGDMDVAPLLDVPRGSLAYAVFFAALNEAISTERKLELACHANPNVRAFAADLLASSVPYPFLCASPDRPPETPPPGIDSAVYEADVQALAKQALLPDKQRLYEELLLRYQPK